MIKKKSDRNKTIQTSLDEGKFYLDRCIEISSPQKDLSSTIDSTILGDMFSVCQLLPEKSIDLIIADPPYNLTKKFNSKQFSKKTKSEYEKYTHDWLQAVKPLLKENGSIYICCDWESSLLIGNVLMEYFTIQNRITWQREKGRGAKANWKNSMEDIWFASNGRNYTFNLDDVKVRRKVVAPYRVKGKPKDWEETEEGNFRDTCPSNFWDDITIPFWSMAENTAHPTQKSEKLIAKMILASSKPGDIVFDPFLGSGTSSVVAKKLGRHYIGIERDPQYCVWAEQRLEMANADSEIQGYVDGVFWERNTLSQQKRTSLSTSKSTSAKK
ncbi:MAG TPA: site-specific DNA-methyltransferase [Clostridiaceae bacterium]|nr:site-specific DNA-methyltransferase [Clostridiaceae bacterium]